MVETNSGVLELYRSLLIIHAKRPPHRLRPVQLLEHEGSRRSRPSSVSRAASPTGRGTRADRQPRRAHRRLRSGPVPADRQAEARHPSVARPAATGLSGAHLRAGVPAIDAEFGLAAVHAQTGEQLYFAPAARHAGTAGLGGGLSVTPLAGPFQDHELNISAASPNGPKHRGSHAQSQHRHLQRQIRQADTDSKRRIAIVDGSLPLSQSDSAVGPPADGTRCQGPRPLPAARSTCCTTISVRHTVVPPAGRPQSWDNDEFGDPQLIQGIT